MELAHRAVTGRLNPQGQAEDLDEANRAGMIEGVVGLVGGQAPVVQRQR